MVETLSAAAARRVALAAQGFGRGRPTTVGTRQLNLEIQRLGLLQLDSVNVFERSHYLPLFARLGAYDRAALDKLTFGRKANYTEYWAHMASLIPVDDWPLWRFDMETRRARNAAKPEHWMHANADMLGWLKSELASRGPMQASKIEHEANKRRGSWWEWSDVKIGLEVLFGWGEVVSAGRTRFERTYGLPEQVLPGDILNREVAKDDAIRTLMLDATRAHGIGTLSDLADYYRLSQADAKAALHDLIDDGSVLPVTVKGWNSAAGKPLPVFLHRDARVPRRIDATAFLSPFDPVVWRRERALRLFDFHYRIEIYTPAPKRIFGYYSLPILIDDALVGRIDLKSDRQNGVLRVQSAWREAGRGGEALTPEAISRIAQQLRETAAWQQLDAVEVMNRGDLTAAIAAELGVPSLEASALATAEEPAVIEPS